MSAFPPARAETLPPLRRPLVGRDDELAALSTLLSREGGGLVTLIGPGGVGKTRLALELATRLRPAFADGARFVTLADCAEPSFVAATIGVGLGIPQGTGQEPLAATQAYCAARRLLLVIDNWEHLLSATPVVAALLAAAPGLTILATSRVPLRLSGEREYLVAPLPTAVPGHPPDRAPATTLFINRVRDFRPDFVPDEADARAIAAICARLDGLPLALELAAPRLKLFSPPALLARLEGALALLTGGARDLPDRQRTLRATLDWSHTLLQPEEQRLLGRLAVFADGCTWGAAELVCGDDIAPEAFLDAMTGLVDHGLLRRIEVVDEPEQSRFRLLYLVREYALERLAANAESDAIRARHAAYFLALAEEAEPHLEGGRQSAWQQRLAVEEANLRTALRWAIERPATSIGLQLAGALARFWTTRGAYSEGQNWLVPLLARAASDDAGQVAPTIEAKAALTASQLAWRTGNAAAAEAGAEHALGHYRALDDQAGAGRALRMLANVRIIRREYATARQLLEEAAECLRTTPAHVDLAWVLYSLGELARVDQGDYARAEGHYREALTLGEGLGPSQGLATWRGNLGMVLLRQGRHGEAAGLIRDALELRVLLQHRRGIAVSLEEIAALAAATGHGGEAARLYGAAERLRAELGAPRTADPADEAEHQHHTTTACRQLGEASWAAAVAAGQRLTPEEGLAEALALLTATPPAEARPAVAAGLLTHREREVAALVARGLSNRTIAEELSIAQKTVANHIDHILTKLDFRSRAQIAAWAVRSGLADDTSP